MAKKITAFSGTAASMAVAAVALSVALAGCGKSDDAPAPIAGNQPQPQQPAPPAPAPAHPQVSGNLSEHIEAVSLVHMGEQSRIAKLSLEIREGDAPAESPQALQQLRTYLLQGRIEADGRATLVSDRGLALSARLLCRDQNCFDAEVEIDKGVEYATGHAVIRQSATPSVSVRIRSRNRFNNSTVAARIADQVRDGSYAATLLTREIVSISRKFFELQIRDSRYSNPQGPGYPGYYDPYDNATGYGRNRPYSRYRDRDVTVYSISGSEGPYRSVTLMQNSTGRAYRNLTEREFAEVRFRGPQDLSVYFHRDNGIRVLDIGGTTPTGGYPQGWGADGDVDPEGDFGVGGSVHWHYIDFRN